MILDWISGLFDKDKEKETKTEQPAATSANTAQEAPTTTTSTVTSTKKEDDPFLQGFNYYDNDGKSLPGSFPKQAVRRSVTKPIDSPIVVNKKEDPFRRCNLGKNRFWTVIYREQLTKKSCNTSVLQDFSCFCSRQNFSPKTALHHKRQGFGCRTNYNSPRILTDSRRI
ncbi:MAG: hypothetical protein IKU65_05020 [Oscillospiraceae bacterium]|nr:hypothetical protein [Oscillospiraceae bacterium]